MSHDNITIEFLNSDNLAEVARLPANVLYRLQAEVTDELNGLRKAKGVLDAALERKYGETAMQRLKDAGKDVGSVTLEDDGVKVKFSIPKTVRWDQKKLVDILNSLDKDEAAFYAKSEFKVDERKFNAAPPDIKGMLESARTVETGKPRISLETED